MGRKKNKVTLKQLELHPDKEIIILFENHYDNNAPQASNFLLNTLSAGRITDLVLEETEEYTAAALIKKYNHLCNVAIAEQQDRLKYFADNLDTIQNAIDKGIKVHSADVKVKLYDQLQSDHKDLNDKLHRHFNSYMEKLYSNFLE